MPEAARKAVRVRTVRLDARRIEAALQGALEIELPELSPSAEK
jgi:hypothetical protein